MHVIDGCEVYAITTLGEGENPDIIFFWLEVVQLLGVGGNFWSGYVSARMNLRQSGRIRWKQFEELVA